jgi:hypothetical protein
MVSNLPRFERRQVMAINESGTKILLDVGDPAETKEIKGLLGRIDGQTTPGAYRLYRTEV